MNEATCYLCGPRGTAQIHVVSAVETAFPELKYPVRIARPYVCDRCKAEHLEQKP